MWVAAHVYLMEDDLTILDLAYKDAEAAKKAVDEIIKESDCFDGWRENGLNGQWEKSCTEEIFVVRRVKIGA